ncbi:uncharacterized protein YqhQ [Hydrogenispora ethanolica]|jgi:uncharacterized protein YqhQ|uniref:Uncharacterized protein YqhQ n=1 Tax=Hydrogenispora ethanolica TaxID=1082276 RepID=A0A4R1RNE0_HYDET|nr:DUF1385 domain-containing protein [Hydrogenispora ethanolica]TCL67352.1 uncharacterized protein YqhQ [Hydrogenispora ethanolica]
MKQPEFSYGGQAVIEGVMMRGREYVAVAVRKANGEIVIKKDPVGSVAKKYPFLKWPFIRGVVALCDSFGVGLKALLFSADQFMEGEGEAEGKAAGDSKLSAGETAMMVATALAMTVVLFVVLPLLGRMLVNKFLPGAFWGNLFESVLRFVVFILYIVSVSMLKDIQRVFAYHGAEHKVINTFEAKKDLTVENTRQFTTFHPRCGTSFLLFVVVISAIFFSFLHYDTIWARLLSRILLLPVVAGFSYEVIKFTGRHQDFFLWRWMSLPGMWLQKLTTREPDDSQVEVAINALVAVLKEEAPVIVGGRVYAAEKVEAVQAEPASAG